LATWIVTGIGAGAVDEGDDGAAEVDGKVGELGGVDFGGRVGSLVDVAVLPAEPAGLEGVAGEVRVVGDDGVDGPAGPGEPGATGDAEAEPKDDPSGPEELGPAAGCDELPGAAELPG